MNKVVIDAIIHLDEIVLEKFNALIDAQVLAEQDSHMEHMILELFPEEWRENILVRLESVDVYPKGYEVGCDESEDNE